MDRNMENIQYCDFYVYFFKKIHRVWILFIFHQDLSSPGCSHPVSAADIRDCIADEFDLLPPSGLREEGMAPNVRVSIFVCLCFGALHKCAYMCA